LVWQSPTFTCPRSGQDVSSRFDRKFEPQKMPNEYAEAIHELVQAKVEERAPAIEIETQKRESPKVVNIMDALKKSMQGKGQTKVRDAVRKRMGKEPASEKLARERVPS
jgi:DNA end-binding protein Ku